MNVCIVGWYGTETLGDRAILDGIVSIFQSISLNNYFYIGSLYPLVTKRTLFEDSQILSSHGGKATFFCFDVKNTRELKKNIENSDMVVMGGGPLMDIQEMYVVERAFRLAHRKRIPAVLMGCGFGPLHSKEYQKCLNKIVSYSELIIMRSSVCKDKIQELTKKEVHGLCDPAIISAAEYKRKNHATKREKTLLMNFRDTNYVYHEGSDYVSEVSGFINHISNSFSQIVLYPMHSFSVGGDDREIENKIAFFNKIEKLVVINKPLSLSECYETISSASCCVGTRYHSIVFQTILNGNNYVIDYTDKKNGKISSFLSEYGMWNFYKNRYVSLSDGTLSNLSIEYNDVFLFDSSIAEDNKKRYVEAIKKIISPNNNYE